MIGEVTEILQPDAELHLENRSEANGTTQQPFPISIFNSDREKGQMKCLSNSYPAFPENSMWFCSQLLFSL